MIGELGPALGGERPADGTDLNAECMHQRIEHGWAIKKAWQRPTLPPVARQLAPKETARAVKRQYHRRSKALTSVLGVPRPRGVLADKCFVAVPPSGGSRAAGVPSSLRSDRFGATPLAPLRPLTLWLARCFIYWIRPRWVSCCRSRRREYYSQAVGRCLTHSQPITSPRSRIRFRSPLIVAHEAIPARVAPGI